MGAQLDDPPPALRVELNLRGPAVNHGARPDGHHRRVGVEHALRQHGLHTTENPNVMTRHIVDNRDTSWLTRRAEHKNPQVCQLNCHPTQG